MKKIDKNYFIVFIWSLLLILLTIKFSYMFGSTTDWISQHIVFPDYFRRLFYETHNLFPSLALNLGAGQNIYYVSYYGLYNPIILFSYILPFVDMATYITVSSIILYVLFGLLTYKWLKNNSDNKTSIIFTLVVLMASPIVFHLHRHIMFVSYLPFLVLGLIGIDKYINNNKSLLLQISIVLMILTSYYYSVTSIVCLIIYYLYKCISREEKLNVKDIIIKLLKLFVSILIPILVSSILLVPTFMALLQGRSSTDISLIDLLLPKINIDSIVYDNYSIGLTASAVVLLLISFLSKQKENRFLSVTLFVISSLPIIIYLLNGTLYIRDKILIPFIPLYGLIMAKSSKDILDKKIPIINIITVLVSTSIIFVIFRYLNIYYYIELVLIVLVLLTYYKTDKKIILILYLLIASILNFYIANSSEKYVKISDYKELNSKVKYDNISNVLDKEKGMVRTSNLVDSYYGINKVYADDYNTTSIYSSSSNEEYRNFYINVFKNNLPHRNNLMLPSTSNILFNTYMGVKYIYSSKDVFGYNKINDNMYENNNVLPMFYVRYDTFNENKFDKLDYPYNVEVLLNNVITTKSKDNNYHTNIEKIDLKYNYEKNDELEIENKNDMYYIDAAKDVDIVLNLEEKLENKILFIDFKLNNQHECDEKDSEIRINGVVNKLTCNREFYQNDNYVFHYVISGDEIDKLNITIKKGLYIIDNINTYILDYDHIKDIKRYITEASVDNKTSDVFDLSVNAIENGYFVSTLPYDDNYKIYVDNKQIKYEKINKAFIGFKIKKGKHNIKITYKSKGLLLGQILSIAGVIGLVVYQIINKKK